MKYLILGAGPSGLTFANTLLRSGETDFLVLERENEPGGLCRSANVDGSPFDVGGGHFLDVKKPNVTEYMFSFLPKEEWDRYERDSQIDLYGDMMGSPMEANIWQLPEDKQKKYLDSIAVAGCNTGEEKPEKFTDWIRWKLGDAICEDYMIPYNQKMFGDDLDSLGTYWLEKLPNVSYEETLMSCKNHKPYGTQPGHANFYYPKKYGYGEAFIRMGKALGDKLICGERVSTIDIDNRIVNGKYKADVIINTIPLKGVEIINLPKEYQDIIDSLKFSSVVTTYEAQRLDTTAHWIYYPDINLSYHRILVRHNFCPDSKGYWTETNLTRFDEPANKDKTYFINDFAYPLNTIGKEEAMAKLLTYLKSKDIIGLGRFGEWQHYNSDVVMDRAMKLALELK